MTTGNTDQGIIALIGNLADQASTLVQTEARLLRAELSEKVSEVGSSLLQMMVGAMCLLAALLVLLQAVVIGLAELGLGMGWASLLVGIAVAVVGAVTARMGSAKLQAENLTPTRTKEQLESDARVLKEQIR